MKKIIGSIAFLILSFSCVLNAQYGQSEILPELNGDELVEALVDEYQAQILFFNYGTSRDTMFRNVYAVNDSLSCVYSGHTLYMNPNADPTTTVYMNGSDDGINTEHTFPQSKGAGFGNARSDMHHLFPTRAKVNEERSNFPFGDIDDEDTDIWFYKNQALFSKPTSNIDAYSEWKWQTFEPREAHKGNVARAMMYFYTMYKNQADNADPVFFSSMVATLCEWHFLDPVDSLEYARTNLIAKWQVYPNPFVLDCSLASRTYCSLTSEACALAVGIQEDLLEQKQIKAYYSQQSNAFVVNCDFSAAKELKIAIYDVAGNLILNEQMGNVGSGSTTFKVLNKYNSSGILFMHFQFQKNGSKITTEVHKINVFN